MPSKTNVLMHPKTTARLAALKALVALEGPEANLGTALTLQGIGSENRPFANDLLLGVIRHRGRLDYTLMPLLKKPLDKLDAPIRAALRMALFEVAHQGRPVAVAANEYAELTRSLRMNSAVAFVNAVARRLPAEHRPSPPISSPVAHISVEYSFPQWIIKRWLTHMTAEGCAQLCAASNAIAPLCLRVNTLRASREDILASLQSRGLTARPGALSPDAILMEDAGSPVDWPEWREGLVIAQDEAAQLVSRLAGAKPGQTVIDAAAAPGGKATHLAQIMGNEGKVIACEVAPGRTKLISANASRLGTSIVELRTGDFRALAADLPAADVVLLDAPCTGTGTLRRRPDIKWRKNLDDLNQLVALQRSLLASAARAVKPGGCLVYSTCSLEPEENEEQVAWWLGANEGWALGQPPAGMPDSVALPEGYISTRPDRDGCDGMFAAKLVRTG